MRRLNTNKTSLHRIRLKKFVPNDPLEDKYKEEKLQPDESIIIPQADLYTISWEADFEYELLETRKDDWPDKATRLPNDAVSGEVDYYVTENVRCSADQNAQCSNEQSNEGDVTEYERKPKAARSNDATSPLSESPTRTENENDVSDNKISRDRPAAVTRRPL